MASKNTMLLIDKETHAKIKTQASENGMTLMGYIKVLVDRDSKR